MDRGDEREGQTMDPEYVKCGYALNTGADISKSLILRKLIL